MAKKQKLVERRGLCIQLPNHLKKLHLMSTSERTDGLVFKEQWKMTKIDPAPSRWRYFSFAM